MKPIERVLFHPICVLSHLMCACNHCNTKLSLCYLTRAGLTIVANVAIATGPALLEALWFCVINLISYNYL